MVLLDVVSFEVLAFFLKGFLIDAADKAFFCFIFEHFLPFRSQRCKIINENTSKNVSKEHVHEDDVYHIICKPSSFKLIHVLSDLLFNIEFDHAVIHGLTMYLRILLRVYGVSIVRN